MIRKELVAASAEPLILSLLAKGESYGYAIIQEVKARSGRQIELDGRNALPGVAPDGTSRLDQIALGRKRNRAEAEILLAQKGRQNRDGQTSGTMVAGAFRFGRFEKGAICLTSKQSIAEWRKQMLAAGIKTPVPLEELEIHLREEIERQMQSGMNEQASFISAVQNSYRRTGLKTNS